MDVLQNQFLQTIVDHHMDLIVDLVAQKARDAGVELTSRQRQRVFDQIARGEDIDLRAQSWKVWENKAVQVKFTEQDIRDVEERLHDVINRMPELVDEISDCVAQDMLGVLIKEWPSVRQKKRRESAPFDKKLAERWGPQLDALAMLLELATEVGAFVSDKSRNDSANQNRNLTEILTRLQARACQVASEIHLLAAAGYADGAMARWRTLHEIAVVSMLIARDGEELAERYRLFDSVQVQKSVWLYQEKHKRLGFEPLSVDELDQAKKNYEAVCERYGPGYSAEYGWAAEAVGKKRPKFRDIEEAAGLDHLRPYFAMASNGVHANPRGVFVKLGLASDDVLLVGPSDIGLGDPLHGAAISLAQATTTLFKLVTTLDLVVAAKIMIALGDGIAESNKALGKPISS